MEERPIAARYERLYRLTEELRGGGPTSVPALARQFGVSERTIARDLALLRDQEIPIEGVPGPSGGVRLLSVQSSRRPTLQLSDIELAALWLSVWLTASRAAPTGAEPAVSAFEKVAAGLPPAQRRRLAALARNVLVGDAAGRHLAAGSAPPQPGVVAALAHALERRCVLELRYHDGEDRETERVVEPHALLVQVPLWYLLALDRTREAPRTFRLDRVIEARARPDLPFTHLELGPLFPELSAAGVASI